MSIPTSVLRSMASNASTAAFHVAGVRGYEIPQDITDARAALAELDAIDRSSLPPSLPSTGAKKLRSDLTKIASDARAHHDLLEAAREARPLLISRQVQATRAATSGWATTLAGEWDTTWADFVAVRPSAGGDRRRRSAAAGTRTGVAARLLVQHLTPAPSAPARRLTPLGATPPRLAGVPGCPGFAAQPAERM